MDDETPPPIPEEPNGFLLGPRPLRPPPAPTDPSREAAERLAAEVNASLAEARRGMRFLRPDGSIGP